MAEASARLRRLSRFASSLLIVAALLGTSSYAQQIASGVVSGRATDQTGAAVAAAKITLKDARSGAELDAESREDGSFRFEGIGAGEYQLRVEAEGFRAASQSVEARAAASVSEYEIRLLPLGADEFVTVIAGDDGYIARTATTAMRTDVPLRDTPQSIQVVTRRLLDEQQVITVNDAVRNVSGVSVPNSSGGRAEDFTIRGFTSARNTYKDGFRNDFNSNRAAHEMSNVERVEVLKGPASVLYGRLDPAGVVNLVTKRPPSEHYYSAQFTAGKFNLVRPTIDFGGPLNESKTLLYRFNAAYENADTFRNFNERERLFVAPVLTWIIGEKTVLNFDAEAMKGSSLIDRGLIAVGSGVAPIPLSTYLGDPAIPYKYRQGKAGVNLSHFFNQSWSLRSAFRVALNKADYDSRQPRRLRPDNRTLELSLDFADQSLQTYYWQNDFVTKPVTGFIRHNIVFGFDLTQERFASVTLSGPARTIDIYNPTYNFAPGAITLRGDSTTTNKGAGFYAQDLLTLRDDLKVLVGGRFDYFDQRNENRFNRTNQNAIDRKFTPRVGLVYQPVEPVSLYASYSRSFQPQLQLTYDNTPFLPETGAQYEAGVKLDMFDRRLASTIAVYQITRQGVSTPDTRPGIPSGFNVQIGEQRSRGFEFDLTARLTRSWNLTTTYGYTDALITQDNTRPGATPIVGNELLGVPRHTASLWSSYELDRGLLRGVGFGAGVFAVDRRFGDNEHTFTVPGYARVDASVFYRILREEKTRYRLAFNLNNLLDKRYYEGVRGRLGIVPGAPLNGIASLQVVF